jgi:hypothetical protein
MFTNVSPETIQLLTVAYGVMGFVSLAGYGPQFLAFWRNPSLCQNTPLTTWSVWSVQTVVFHIYAWVVNGDMMFILTTGLFMLATLTCLGLLVRGRWMALKARMMGRAVSNVVPMSSAA